ncbi:unnamed protein product [Arabidopsis halleri]
MLRFIRLTISTLRHGFLFSLHQHFRSQNRRRKFPQRLQQPRRHSLFRFRFHDH